jgi:signal transduction histidine kinase/ligand-binding sensor domain-containing protein
LRFQPMTIPSTEKAGDEAGKEPGGDGAVNNEAINAILPVGKDELWIGTDGRGVLHQTGASAVNISEQAGHFHERVRNFRLDSNGVLWIATQNGVERYKGGRLEMLAETGMVPGDIFSTFAEDGNGGMFYVTSSGLYHWYGGKVVPFPLHLARGEAPVAVYRDLQQRIWIGTNSHVMQLVPHSGHLHDAEPQFENKVRATISGIVSTMVGDALGNLWIGTRHSGLWRLASDGLFQWTTGNGLSDDAIRCMFLDDEQNLWIGMLSGGLSRWRKGALAPYGVPEGFHAAYAANVLADSHNDLWLGTWDKGLFRLHNGRLIDTTPPTMPSAMPIRALAEDKKGQIWVGTWFDGVYRYDGREFHHYLLGNESPGNAVSAMLPARGGGLWVGTYTGLLYFPSGEPDRQKRVAMLESQLVTCLAEDKDGSILVGTSTGLYRVRNGKAEAVMGLARAYILSITPDSAGYLWVGTKAGGLRLVRDERVIAVPTNAGLPNFTVNTATEDGDGHLWLGTSRGIVRVPLKELHEVVNGRRSTISTVLLDKADGMRSSECSGLSGPLSARLADGMLWFVTTKGYVYTTDVAEKMSAAHPVASIMGWTPSIDPNSADLVPTSSNTEIVLEPGHTDLLLFFNAKLLSNPGDIEFRYRLAGYDAAWTTTRARVARYRRLPPGTYAFEVQARSAGEDWSTPLASIMVRQRPYLYQSWYFYVAILTLMAAVAVQLFRRRMQLMKGRIGIILEERSRIARECHDTLMAGFAAVSWQLEATAKLFRDSKSENTPPAQSCELARSMVAHCQAEARRIIWDLRDTDEVTGILSHALTRTLSMNVAPEMIETTFDVDGEELPLAPGCVHQLVCIGQEAVSNAIRHANPTRIMIHLKYEVDMLVLSILDNGCGFQHSHQSEGMGGHFGIPVMEERARKVGGVLRVTSAEGGGTEVTVKVPFNEWIQATSPERHVIRWIGI